MSEELFNRLISDLEDSPQTLPGSLFEALMTEDSLHLASVYTFGLKSADILKVMKSGIFYEGALKWKQVRGKKEVYRTIPIKDLVFFIIKITFSLGRPWLNGYWMTESKFMFFNTINTIDTIINEINNLALLVNHSMWSINKIERIRQDLYKMKSYFISKGPHNFPAGRRGKPDHIGSLIDIFKEEVPDAKLREYGPESKPYAIATAIQKLLSQFGIAAEHAAILQRIKRSASNHALPATG